MTTFRGLGWLRRVQTSQLIDGIVRQTARLVARLATTSGLRAPLAHVGSQIFLDLVSELEGQGVSRKVIADMFGLALRSYQQKVQRLQESTTERGTTLWEAILGFIQEHPTTSRTQILARFSEHDGATVRGVLNDLVGSSLVYRTGSAEATVYRATQFDEAQGALRDAERLALLEHFQSVVGAMCSQLDADNSTRSAATLGAQSLQSSAVLKDR